MLWVYSCLLLPAEEIPLAKAPISDVSILCPVLSLSFLDLLPKQILCVSGHHQWWWGSVFSSCRTCLQVPAEPFCHHGPPSRSFENSTICSSGSPFLKVPSGRAGSWGRHRMYQMFRGWAEVGCIVRRKTKLQLWKKPQPNPTVNKSHIGLSPL